MSAKILGADYTPRHEGVLRTRAEWQVVIAQTLKAGGYRRVDSDASGPVTFLHDVRGVMRHEIYANVPSPIDDAVLTAPPAHLQGDLLLIEVRTLP